jgi:hypothetical protein
MTRAESLRLLRAQFPLFSGREVKSTGQGFILQFLGANALAFRPNFRQA